MLVHNQAGKKYISETGSCRAWIRMKTCERIGFAEGRMSGLGL